MTLSRRSITSWAACCLALAALVAGCGGKSEDEAPSGGATGGEVTTGPGITDSKIRLGVLTDLSGVFAPLADPGLKATQLYWKEQNANGGVCERQIELVVKDHGYDPQKAVVQYRDISPDVAAMQQLLGSPITAALLPTLETDSMLSLLVAWPSSLLAKDFIIEVGSPYDIEMINGLSYMMDEGLLKEGDTIGHIYFEGEYGENGLAGAQAFAEENGLKLVEQKVEPTDEDMTGQVSAFKNKDVKAILLTTAPTQMASAAGIAAAQKYDVKLLGNSPTYDPALLETPAADALKANALIGAPIAPYNAKDPGVKAATGAFDKAHPKDVKKGVVNYGWGAGIIMKEVLEAACENGDLSRAGILEAARSLDAVDVQGITPGESLNYSEVGEPPTRASFIAKPADVPGGLELVDEVESEFAGSYQIPGSS
jgi:ABC-type branched-subunit amino acid transport system substrate-binding protein